MRACVVDRSSPASGSWRSCFAAGYLAASAVAWADTTAVDSTCVDDRPGQTPENFVASWRLHDGPTVDAEPYRFGAKDVAFKSLTPASTCARSGPRRRRTMARS